MEFVILVIALMAVGFALYAWDQEKQLKEQAEYDESLRRVADAESLAKAVDAFDALLKKSAKKKPVKKAAKKTAKKKPAKKAAKKKK